ncbi:MAG: Gfo/Idh/MocA family oxidoreductase [Chloroflexota bacterium]
MRGLVVGLGSIGRRHARNWTALDLGPLAICRQVNAPQPEPLGVDATVFDDLDAALNWQPDVVFVTNPTSLHLEVACLAVQANAHVLVEKPISHTLAGIEALIADARARQRHITVGYNLRFVPGLARLRELVHAGAVGRVVTARAEAGEYLPDWHPWEDYRQGYSARQDLGGGAVLTFSHEIDALCWTLGAPNRVTALVGHASSLEIDADDVADIVVGWIGGAQGTIHMDYVRRPRRRTLEVVGERGVVRWEYEANRVLHSQPETGQWRMEQSDPAMTRNDMYLDELRDLAACVRGERETPLVTAEQGAAVLAIALAAQASSGAGRMIDLHADGAPVTTWLSSLERP